MKKFLNLTGFIIFTISLLTSTQPVLAEEGVIGTAITNPNQSNPSLQYTGCGGKTVSPFNADYEQRVVELVNRERANRGLPLLMRSEGLTQAARYQAADMGQDNYFGHDTKDRVGGKLVFVCGPWERIATYYSGASGENAAAGYSTPEAVMQGWMGSDGHKANILNPSNRVIGVGFYQGSGDFNYYWVQDFGTQIDSYDTPALGNLPNNLVFYYSISDGRLYPDFQKLTPTNTGNDDQLRWQITKVGSFFSATPDNGTTPASIQVSPINFNQSKPATLSGEITTTVTEPASAEGSPHTTQVKLVVVDHKIHQVFIPGILK